MEGIENNFTQNIIQEYFSENRTPVMEPVETNYTNEIPNSNIYYYHEVYKNENNDNINTNQFHEVLDNKNKKNDETKETSNEIKKEQSTTNISTEDIPQPQIVNIVSMVELCCKLNLREIALKCTNSEYNPKRINAVIMRIKEPKTAALIFNTGIIICLGAKNEGDSRKAAKIFAVNIKRLGYNVKFKNFKIVNIVGTCDLKFNIKLNPLNAKINYGFKNSGKKICHYEPELFPGLIYHMSNPQLTLLIFSSGKINFVGAKNKNDIYEANKNIYPFLSKFKSEVVPEKNDTKEENAPEFNYVNID